MRPTKLLPSITLFLSASTLICCALPALFVALGAGASLVSLLGAFPQLLWFSEHKALIFTVAGAFLAINLVLRMYAPRQCPSDPKLAEECTKTQRISLIILIASVALYLLGGFFAFVAPWLM
jgi:hypothetical protein